MRQIFRLPSARDWRLTALGLIVFGLIAVPFGLVSGVYSWAPEPDLGSIARVALIAFIAPAFFEELVFRGPLTALKSNGKPVPAWLIAISLAAFIAWHPLNTFLFMPQAAELFTDWRFLAVAGWLGVVATALALRTRSIWTAIIFHWAVVVGWKALLGAPQFL